MSSVLARVNISKNECYEIISQSYIKINDRIENNKLDIKNMKHYFGMTTYNLYYDLLKEEIPITKFLMLKMYCLIT